MTIIWAKQIKWKWNLFSDDCISLWDYKISAANNYRRKIRTLPRAKNDIYVASSWTCRQTDLVINNIDKVYSRLTDEEQSKLDKYLVKDLLQESIVEAVKVLKEIDEDNPNFVLLVLDTGTNTMYLVETFSVIILEPHVEYIWWSWDVFFHSLHKVPSNLSEEDKFIQDFRLAAKDAPWCWGDIYQVLDGWLVIYPEISNNNKNPN